MLQIASLKSAIKAGRTQSWTASMSRRDSDAEHAVTAETYQRMHR